MTRPRSSYTYAPIAVSAPGSLFTFEAGRSSLVDRTDAEPNVAVERGALGLLKRALRFLFVAASEDAHSNTYVVWERDHAYRTRRDLPRWRRVLRGACPWAGWIDGDGTAAVLHADDELCFFAPDGTPSGSVNVLAVLEADPVARAKIAPTTAGSFWTRYPVGFFAPSPRGLRFCLLLTHGQRVLFDPAKARRVDEELSEDASASARQWVLTSLAEAIDQGNWAAAGAYAIVAGRERIHDAVPLLLALEQESNTESFSRSDGVWSYMCSAPRMQAQHALARLDVDFEPSNAFGVLDAPRPTGWRQALITLPPGSSAEECFAQAGAPAFIGGVGGEWIWEYDVRDESSYATVRLYWNGNKLKLVEHRSPPPWYAEDYRDAGM